MNPDPRELAAAITEVVLHDLALEVYDGATDQWLLRVNTDGSKACADDCRGCAALAVVRSRLVVLEQERDEARGKLKAAMELAVFGRSPVSVAGIPQEDTTT